MHEIQSLAEFNDILTNNKYVVVDFFATWCGPCKAIKPKFSDLSKTSTYEKVYFCAVDIDQVEEIAQVCDVTSLPTFLFYKNGQNEDELIGADVNKLKHKLDDLVK